jgi:hypothetical protein
MFREMQPLGSFGARIRMAYLMGICEQETYKDLILISKIRNEFAHKAGLRNFKESRIAGLCSSMNMIQMFKNWDEGRTVPTHPNDLFLHNFFAFQGLNIPDLRFRFVPAVASYGIMFNAFTRERAHSFLKPQPSP